MSKRETAFPSSSRRNRLLPTEEFGRSLNPYYLAALHHEDVEDDYSEESCGPDSCLDYEGR